MSGPRSGAARWLAGAAAGALVLSLASTSGPAGAAAGAARAAPAAAPTAGQIPAPQRHGSLRITGQLRDGATVTAAGLSWRPGKLPSGDKLLSFEVGYDWRACPARGRCGIAADSTAAPFAARRYVVGHADTGKRLAVTVTATEVVETDPATFAFSAISASVSFTTTSTVAAYLAGRPPVTEFVNGTPERRTASDAEYFQVNPAHFSAADGRAREQFRVDGGRWQPVPASRIFYSGKLKVGWHVVRVRSSDLAGATTVSFRWRVVPMPQPSACRPWHGNACWYPPHLNSRGRPMRWDWQIGRVAPLPRTGARAVDIYDIDGFLTTLAEVRAIRTQWRAATLRHPKLICYLDLAWENYRPDGSPGGVFPEATLGNVYYGYPQQRWVDFRQLDALKPMLNGRIAMCARKGFDAVELDDIDSFDPPATTGFNLTPGDAQNFLAYAFNEIHRYGMTALWKNSPYLAWWGRHYADGAVVEECYLYQQCLASQLRGSSQYGITCTGLTGATPCAWDSFSTDRTRQQPTGKWVGEAEYSADNYVCNPAQRCPYPRRFGTFCKVVYSRPDGFAAVKFDVNLDGSTFLPCPTGT